MPKAIFRLLLIEDDPARIARFQSWLPENARLVIATSAGSALGTLKRDPAGTYGGIMLDHDLQMQAKTDDDVGLSGTDLVAAIIRAVPRSVAILVHSANETCAPILASRLSQAGYWVTQISMLFLTEVRFRQWAEEVREIWEDEWLTR